MRSGSECITHNEYGVSIHYTIPTMDMTEDLRDEGWLVQTDEEQQAIEDLRIFAEALLRAVDDQYYWRWSLIILHHALQSFMVCALRGSEGVVPLTEKSAARMLRYLHSNPPEPYPRNLKLDTYTNLFTKIQGSHMRRLTIGRPYEPDEEHRASVVLVDSYRNEFMHFQPKGLLWPIHGLPKECMNILDVIEFLVRDSGNIDFHDQQHDVHYARYMALARSLCVQLREQYDREYLDQAGTAEEEAPL